MWSCPTLLIYGLESDILAAEAATSMVSHLAFGSMVDIGRAGHSVPGDNPEAFEAMVCKFLRGE
jgi:pimeloyl-ACP methyl ester carboxylesterase